MARFRNDRIITSRAECPAPPGKPTAGARGDRPATIGAAGPKSPVLPRFPAPQRSRADFTVFLLFGKAAVSDDRIITSRAECPAPPRKPTAGARGDRPATIGAAGPKSPVLPRFPAPQRSRLGFFAMTAGGSRFVLQNIPSPDRERDDFYPTPPSATRALLSVESFPGVIWEPACGDGAMSRVLEAAGHEVISTDLVDRGFGTAPVDFLLDYRTRAEHVITNPPFKFCEDFARHALNRVPGKVALLARLSWLEGKARRRLFDTTPIARVYVFSERLKMQRGRLAEPGEGVGLLAFAWFVWDRDHRGPVHLAWL